jgi:hypothetical protein
LRMIRATFLAWRETRELNKIELRASPRGERDAAT